VTGTVKVHFLDIAAELVPTAKSIFGQQKATIRDLTIYSSAHLATNTAAVTQRSHPGRSWRSLRLSPRPRLDSSTRASDKLDLFSTPGGGTSVIYSDAVSVLGEECKNKLAHYREHSVAPTEDHTY
jgi:hypothetical protein